jgi:hypothetical protein
MSLSLSDFSDSSEESFSPVGSVHSNSAHRRFLPDSSHEVDEPELDDLSDSDYHDRTARYSYSNRARIFLLFLLCFLYVICLIWSKNLAHTN